MKNEEMTDVMKHLQQYVPIESEEGEVEDPANGETVKITIDHFHYILFGGDQLTVERAFGVKNSKQNENRGLDRIEGLVPVIEDWHAKVIFLKVCVSGYLIITRHIHACTCCYSCHSNNCYFY